MFEDSYRSPEELYALEQPSRIATPFWKDAARSLPAPFRTRYQGYFERAERWELAFDGFMQLLARARSRLARPFHTGAHSA
jgi:hypothetical protein